MIPRWCACSTASHTLRHQLQTLPRVQLVRAGVVHQRRAADELHREVRLRPGAGVGGAGLVDLRDAGMLQARQRLGFALEAPQQLRRWRGRA